MTIVIALTAGVGAVAFVWPRGSADSTVDLGLLSDVVARLDRTGTPPFPYDDPPKFFVSRYPLSSLPQARVHYSEEALRSMRLGLIALVPFSTQLHERLHFCASSGWFEDPLHGGKFNAVGEKVGGPAPRGLDQYVIAVRAGRVIVDLARTVRGPAIGTRTIDSTPRGPQCVT